MAIVEEMNSFHTYAFPNAKSIIVCGDIHGEFNAVIYKLCIQYQMTELLPETMQEGHGRHFLCNSISGLFRQSPLQRRQSRHTALASRQNCSRKPYRKDTGGTSCAILSGLFHRTPLGKKLLQKHEEDGEHKADERCDVVPVESLAFEEEGDNQSEDDEGDNLLDNF